MHKFILLQDMWQSLRWHKIWPHVENMTAAIHSRLMSLFHIDTENVNMLAKCLSAVLRQSLLLLDNKREWQCVILWIETIWVINVHKGFFQNWSRISCFNWDGVKHRAVEVWMEPAVGLHTLNCLKFCSVWCTKEHLVHIKAACAYRMHWGYIHQHVMTYRHVDKCGCFA